MVVKIIRAASNLGYANDTVKNFPSYLAAHGLYSMFTQLGMAYEDCGEMLSPVVHKLHAAPTKTRFLHEIETYSKRLAEFVAKSMANPSDVPLVIGGDHSVAIGSIYGILRKKKKVGVLWIDAHTDIHTHDTTETGWIYGMPTALICGSGAQELLNINASYPFCDPRNVVIFGAQYIDRAEYDNLKKFGVTLISMDEIIENGLKNSLQKAIAIIKDGTDHTHVSLDLDAIDDPLNPGISEHYNGQFTYREIKYICKKIGEQLIVNSLDIVEGDPAKDIKGKTASLTLELIAAFFGKNYSVYDASYLQTHRAI